MTRVLFVCLGNICRSPAAEGILRTMSSAKKQDVDVRSCGLGHWHVGSLPDSRMRAATQRRGIILSSQAQQFKIEFFDEFDYILVVDNEVLSTLYKYASTPEHKSKIHLITEFSTSFVGDEIPDPFYGSEGDFELVLDMLEESCEGFLNHIK